MGTIVREDTQKRQKKITFPEKTGFSQLLNREKARLVLYNLFKGSLFFPNKDFVAYFQNPRSFEDISWALKKVGLNGECSLINISSYMMGRKDIDELLEALSVEYTRLFINSFEGVLANPYESVYKSHDKNVMGQASLDVLKIYRDYGLELSRGYKEPPDHIAVEMEFMAYLIAKEIPLLDPSSGLSAAQPYISGQQKFLKDHLCSWGHLFFDKVLVNTENAFWKDIARIGNAFLEKEALWGAGI